jgi:hypothetical protein
MTPPDDTATIERDLAAVEDALATGAASHDAPSARELQELALRLQADRPAPRPEFAEELHRRMEAGFPRADAVRARQQATLERLARRTARAPLAARTLAREILLPLGGVAAGIAVIVAMVLVAGSPSGSGDSADDGGGGGSVAAPEAAAPQDDRAQGGDTATVAPAPPLPPDGGFAPGQRDRKIERSFALELDVPLDQMARVADGVTTVANRHGGFVLSSSVSSGEDEGGGDFSLRIPSDRLRPALRDLAELAPVIRQSQEGRDVTREHVTAKDRLQAARAERRSLLRRLEEADTDEEAESIRRRLDLVAGEISGLRGQLRDLRLRTDYAVVTVSLVADGDSGAGGAGGSFDDAMDDAGDLLVGFAGVLIRILALALPLGLIALAIWLGTRAVQRRRRESALA